MGSKIGPAVMVQTRSYTERLAGRALTYREAEKEIEREPEAVGEHKEGEAESEESSRDGAHLQGGVEKDALAATSLWLRAKALEAENQQAVSIVHASG